MAREIRNTVCEIEEAGEPARFLVAAKRRAHELAPAWRKQAVARRATEEGR